VCSLSNKFNLIDYLITEDFSISHETSTIMKIEIKRLFRINHINVTAFFLLLYGLISETYFKNAIAKNKNWELILLITIPAVLSVIIYKKSHDYYNKTVLLTIDKNSSIVLGNRHICDVNEVERLQIDTYPDSDSDDKDELVVILKDGTKKLIDNKLHYDVLCKLADVIAEYIDCPVMKDICFGVLILDERARK